MLVFTRQGSMRHGHVSVVTRVISNRLVLVDHANWAPARTSGRGAVTTAVPVLDVSPKNDWSQVRVWFHPTNDFGTRVYRTDGYVYQPRDMRQLRAGVQQVALRAADKAMARPAAHAAGLETSKSEAAKPMVDAIAAEAVVKAAVATAEPAPQAQNPAPSAEGMVKVAKHVFRAHRSNQPASPDNLLFN